MNMFNLTSKTRNTHVNTDFPHLLASVTLLSVQPIQLFSEMAKLLLGRPSPKKSGPFGDDGFPISRASSQGKNTSGIKHDPSGLMMSEIIGKPWENCGFMGFNGVLPSGNLLHSY